jgi:prevent-host-death family protein
MKTVNLYDAKAQLSELVRLAADGEDVLIARHGRPVARLTAVGPERRPPGGWEGQVWIAPDFDEADDELAALLTGEYG